MEDDIDRLEADLKVLPYGQSTKPGDELRAGFTRLMAGSLERSKGLKSAADGAGRELFASEQRDYSKALSIAGRAKVGLDTLDELASRPGLKAMVFPGSPPAGGWDGASGPRTGPLAPGEVRGLKSADRFADVVATPSWPRGQKLGMHGYLRALITGDPSGLPEGYKAMSLSSVGASTVPEPLSAELIDLARDASVLGRAGITTFPMTSSTLKIPRLTAGITPVWHHELDDESEEDAQFDSVTLTARTVMALTRLSVELAEDSPLVDDAINAALGSALAQAIDKAGLTGPGGDAPQGVYGTTGVSSWNVGGPFEDYTELSQAIEAVRSRNEEPNAIIYSARTAGTIDRFVEAVNLQPLQPPPSVREITKLITNGATDDLAFIADWSKLALGMRTSIKIEVSRDASSGSDSAWSSLSIFVRAYARVDFAVLRPGAFQVIEGLSAS